MLGVRSYAYERCYYCSYYYRSIATCGCESWGDYTAWQYSELNCAGAVANSCKTETREVYSYRNNYCPH